MSRGKSKCSICNRDYDETKTKRNLKICPDCAENLPGDGSKIVLCNNCQAPVRSTNGKTIYCPKCEKQKRKLSCLICNKIFYFEGTLQRLCWHKKKFKDNSGICNDCKPKLPGKGKALHFCNNCKSPYLGINSRDCCPKCYNTNRKFECIICHKNYIYRGGGLVKYKTRRMHVCEDCKRALPGKGKDTLTCDSCQIIFRGNASVNPLCPRCRKSKYEFTCIVCKNPYIYKDRHINRYRRKSVKVCYDCFDKLPGKGNSVNLCIDCNKPFKTVKQRAKLDKLCPSCLEVKLKPQTVSDYESLIAAGWIEDGNLIYADIPEDKRIKVTYNCKRCGRGFHKIRSQTHCGFCREVRVCECCNRKFCNVKHPKNRFCSASCSSRNKNHTKQVISNTIPRPKREVLAYTPLNIPITEDMNKPGVWAVFDKHDNVLDVAQTSNIAKEFSTFTYRLTRKPKFIAMKYNGVDIESLSARVIVFENDLINRLLIEEHYAKAHRATYWHPQINTFQTSI